MRLRLAEVLHATGDTLGARAALACAAEAAAETGDDALSTAWTTRGARAVATNQENSRMPRYIIERSASGLTREELTAAGEQSVAVLAGMPEVRWIRSYVSDVEGKIYCK